jgi:putative zinc finger/helix-turn-helix YgiT family protein
MYNDTRGQQEEKESCLECGSTKLLEQMREQQFTYGTEGKEVLLTASMPVIKCEECGYECFDERGEAARHAAVCKHLGVYAPSEIRAIREATCLRRNEFCELTGFGSASLQRWESGAVVPNASSDRLISLLRYADNIERLRGRYSDGELIVKDSSGVVIASSSEIDDECPVQARTRNATKIFPRLAHKPRVIFQARSWALRAR